MANMYCFYLGWTFFLNKRFSKKNLKYALIGYLIYHWVEAFLKMLSFQDIFCLENRNSEVGCSVSWYFRIKVKRSLIYNIFYVISFLPFYLGECKINRKFLHIHVKKITLRRKSIHFIHMCSGVYTHFGLYMQAF